MKRRFFAIAVLSALFAVTSVAGDLPVVETDVDVSDLLADSYEGTLVVAINGQQMPPSKETIVVDRGDGGNVVGLRLNNFKLPVVDDKGDMSFMYIGNIYVSDIALTENGGVVSFSKDQTIRIAEGNSPEGVMWMGPFIGDVPVSISGQGSYSALALTINISLVGLGQTIQVNFSSNAETPVAISAPFYGQQEEEGRVSCQNRRTAVPDGFYSLSGRRLAGLSGCASSLPKGVYIVYSKGESSKVVVR